MAGGKAEDWAVAGSVAVEMEGEEMVVVGSAAVDLGAVMERGVADSAGEAPEAVKAPAG